MTITAEKATAHKKIGTDKDTWEGTYKIKGADSEADLNEFYKQFDRYLLKKTGQTTLDPQEDED